MTSSDPDSTHGATPFTGERLHAGQALFAVDLARHRAAYRFALERIGTGRTLDLGSGSGYGTVELASQGAKIWGLDRVTPDPQNRHPSVHFVRGDLEVLPLRPKSFDWVLSFQVIEHLEDPDAHFVAMRRLLHRDGSALVTTPNRLASDGVNPFHVREYIAEELASLAAPHFDQVQMLGVGTSDAVREYLEARARRVAALLRLDPLGLRHRLPKPLIHWLFGRLAILVRKNVQRQGKLPQVSWRDFPMGPVEDACLDLLALCRGPRP